MFLPDRYSNVLAVFTFSVITCHYLLPIYTPLKAKITPFSRNTEKWPCNVSTFYLVRFMKKLEGDSLKRVVKLSRVIFEAHIGNGAK